MTRALAVLGYAIPMQFAVKTRSLPSGARLRPKFQRTVSSSTLRILDTTLHRDQDATQLPPSPL